MASSSITNLIISYVSKIGEAYMYVYYVHLGIFRESLFVVGDGCNRNDSLRKIADDVIDLLTNRTNTVSNHLRSSDSVLTFENDNSDNSSISCDDSDSSSIHSDDSDSVSISCDDSDDELFTISKKNDLVMLLSIIDRIFCPFRFEYEDHYEDDFISEYELCRYVELKCNMKRGCIRSLLNRNQIMKIGSSSSINANNDVSWCGIAQCSGKRLCSSFEIGYYMKQYYLHQTYPQRLSDNEFAELLSRMRTVILYSNYV